MMTALEAIELFAREMKNEITHSTATGVLEDSLFKAVDEVESVLIQTYEARKNE